MFSSESFKAAYDRYCEVRRAILEEEERIRKEFIEAKIAVFERPNSDMDPEQVEEPAEEVYLHTDDLISCSPSVPGHRIPWYTTGFE